MGTRLAAIKFMRLYLMFFLFLVSQPILAKPLCSNLFNPKAETAQLSQTDLKETFSLVKNEIDSLIGELKPVQVKVKASNNFNDSSHEKKRIIIGFHNGEFLTQIDLMTMAHEYGHAVLEKYLPYNPDRHDGGARRAFHEVFADVVAMTYSRDPHSMNNLVKKYQVCKLCLGRDFDVDTDKHHKKWRKAFEDDSRVKDEYAITNPIRWAVWDIVKDKIQTEEYRKKIIPVFFEVIQPYFQKLHALGLKNSDSITPKKMFKANEKIIEDLYESDLMNP